MADVFISYSRDNLARVTEIAKALQSEGLTVWWDPDIVPGTTYDEVIAKELSEARAVIVAWSEAANTSRWVREEANDALERGKLIPVRIEKIAPPLGFRLIQTTDLVSWDGDKAQPIWRQLISRVGDVGGFEFESLAEIGAQSGGQTVESSTTELDYYQLLRPTRFTVLGSIFFGIIRFFREPFTYTFYAVIYLLIPFYLMTFLDQRFWELEAENIYLLKSGSFSWESIAVSFLQIFISNLLSILSVTIFAIKIQAQAAGLRGAFNHIGHLYSKRTQVMGVSFIVAILVTMFLAIGEVIENISEAYGLLTGSTSTLILIVLLTLLCVSALLFVRFYFAPCLAVIEGTKTMLSISNSRLLVIGHSWRLLCLLLVSGVLANGLRELMFPDYAWMLDSFRLWYHAGVAEGSVNIGLADATALRLSFLYHGVADAIAHNRNMMAIYSTFITMAIGLVLSEGFFQIYNNKK